MIPIVVNSVTKQLLTEVYYTFFILTWENSIERLVCIVNIVDFEDYNNKLNQPFVSDDAVWTFQLPLFWTLLCFELWLEDCSGKFWNMTLNSV